METRGLHLKPTLLVEGVKIPFETVSLTFRERQPATAAFTLVPCREIKDIRPRTLFQLFLEDFTKPEVGNVLFYEGEVYAFNYDKTPSSRGFQILTMDVSSLLDEAKAYFINAQLNGTGDLALLELPVSTTETAGVDRIGITAGVKNTIIAMLEEGIKATNGDLTQAIITVINKLSKINAFYNLNSLRYNFENRFSSAPSGMVEKIFKFEKAKNFWGGLLDYASGMMSMREIFQMILDTIFHTFVTVPFPVTDGKVMKQFLIKPDAFMIAPPMCNVVYPHQMVNVNASRNYFAEITRLRARATGAFYDPEASKVMAWPFFAPKFYEDMYVGTTSENPYSLKNIKKTNADGKPIITEEKKVEEKPPDADMGFAPTIKESIILSREEAMKGIFPDFTEEIPSAARFLASMTADENNFRETFAQVMKDTTYYMYYAKRMAARTGSASGMLNLAVVPGFPVVFLDDSSDEQTIIAQLVGVTHTLSCQGGGFTNYEIAYVREIEEKDDFNPRRYAETPIPPWFDPEIFGKPVEFDPSKFGDFQGKVKGMSGIINEFPEKLTEYYKTTLGSSSITTPANPYILSACWKLIEDYRAAQDKGKHGTAVTRREYSTAKKAMEMYKVDVDNELLLEEYRGGTLDEYPPGKIAADTVVQFNQALKFRKAVVQRYRERLSKSRAFGVNAVEPVNTPFPEDILPGSPAAAQAAGAVAALQAASGAAGVAASLQGAAALGKVVSGASASAQAAVLAGTVATGASAGTMSVTSQGAQKLSGVTATASSTGDLSSVSGNDILTRWAPVKSRNTPSGLPSYATVFAKPPKPVKPDNATVDAKMILDPRAEKAFIYHKVADDNTLWFKTASGMYIANQKRNITAEGLALEQSQAIQKKSNDVTLNRSEPSFATQLLAFAEAVYEKTGLKVIISDLYRSTQDQIRTNERSGTIGKGGLAAPVGTSPHEDGRAADISRLCIVPINNKLVKMGTNFDQLLADYGLWRPLLAPGAKVREYWHVERKWG